MEAEVDPFNNKERWETAKEMSLPRDMSKTNKVLLTNYLDDMELGYNVSITKGARKAARLNTLRSRMTRLDYFFRKNVGVNDFTKITEKELLRFFNEMHDGKVLTVSGKPFKATYDYIKTFKAFWHWFMKVSKKEGRIVTDITTDLKSTKDNKPPFVYFDIEFMKKIADLCNENYRPLVWFMFDSGIRTGKELYNVRVGDIYDEKGVINLSINDKTSKTFGRTIKLLLSGRIITDSIKAKNLPPSARIINVSPASFNKYIRRLIKANFKDFKTKGGEYLYKISMYDFRHNSACYWISRYKSESALKYRFGWLKSDMIVYYTNLLGLSDTITQGDLIDMDERDRLSQELEKQKQETLILQEQMATMRASIIQEMKAEILKNMGKM